ncbi:MAG TPA: hypothetical protein VJS42_16645, partial [Steroidobacteraceae bacterium]|nr:hypothetical protein [Steroidobacteraceae bacterium]
MRLFFRFIAIATGMAAACVPTMSVHAETVLATSEMVATTEAAFALPPAKTFAIATAGTYEFELRDRGLPAPLARLRAVIVHDGQTVAQIDLGPGETGIDTFTAEAGDYRIHVLGETDSGQESGLYSIRVSSVSGGTALVDEAGSVNAAGVPSDTAFVALIPVQIDVAGNYSLNLVDQAFPAALQSLDANVLLPDGTPLFGPTGVSTFPASFNASQQGEYVVSVQAHVTAGSAGLYGVNVSADPSGPVIKDVIQAVGTLPVPVTVNLPTTGTYTLKTSDAQFPQSLTSFKTLIIQGSQLLHSQPGETAGVDFTANAGQIKLYSSVEPNGAVGVGSIAVRISQGATPVYASVLIGDVDPDPKTPSIYAANSAALAAGAYKLQVEDFGFPASLTSLRVAVAQADALIDDWIGEGQYTFNAGAAPARILIAAAPSTATSTGLFGIRL